MLKRELLGVAGIGALIVGLATPASAQAPDPQSTFNRIRTTKKLRVGAIVGTEPYFHKDIATGDWSGFCIAMARDLARPFGADLEIVESTWGNTVLDLQSSKIDISFGLSPTPERAMTVEFTTPVLENTFTVITKGDATPKSWSDLDKPSVKVAFDIGSTHDLFARRMLPNATLLALPTPDAAALAVQTGRADYVIQVILLALVSVKKNPQLGRMVIPTPMMQQPTCAGVRPDPDGRFLAFVDSWLAYNRGLGSIRSWILDGLKLVNITPDDVPPQIQF